MWKETSKGIQLAVKIIPKASKNEIVGWEDNELKIRIAALPEKGGANAELIRFLSKILHISKSQITLTSGQKSRHKKVLISGISTEVLSPLVSL